MVAMAGMRLEDGADRLGRAIHEVGARAPMNVDIDKARGNETAAGVDNDRILRRAHDLANRHDGAAITENGAGIDQAVGKNERAVLE